MASAIKARKFPASAPAKGPRKGYIDEVYALPHFGKLVTPGLCAAQSLPVGTNVGNQCGQ